MERQGRDRVGRGERLMGEADGRDGGEGGDRGERQREGRRGETSGREGGERRREQREGRDRRGDTEGRDRGETERRGGGERHRGETSIRVQLLYLLFVQLFSNGSFINRFSAFSEALFDLCNAVTFNIASTDQHRLESSETKVVVGLR